TILAVEDVAFSLEEGFGPRAEEKAVSPTNRNMARATMPFEATGPNTVSVTLTEPQTFFAFFLSEMFAGPRAVIFSQDYRESVGRDGYNLDPSPGTTGPWDLVRHDRGSLMRFERFDDYWKIDERNHRFGTLDLRLIPELSTRVAALRAGEVDLIEANVEVRDQIEGAGGQVIFGPESTYVWFVSEGCWLETAVIPCHKTEVRQALDYAIDKELIANQIYGPEMAETKGWAHVTPSSLGYGPDLDSWPYDPAKARQLLAEADCANAECFPDPYTLFTWEAGEIPFMPEVAQLVCAQWEENLGINCEVTVGDSVSIKDRMHSFQIAGNYVVRPNEDRFDGGSIMWSGYASPQVTRGLDPELRKVVQEATSLIGTTEERHRAYHDMYVLAREQHWEWSLFTVNLPWGVGPKIKDWHPWPMIPYASALWTIELAQ
ncbi:MAG: ABC transporter substrate-binding protein, partial [Dehalococcoidia bacterium]